MSDSPIALAPLPVIRQSRYTDGLRELAAFLDEHPDLIPDFSGVTVYDWIKEDDGEGSVGDIVGRFRERAALLGPEAETATEGQYFNANRKFGPHTLQVTMNRDLLVERPPHPLETPPLEAS